MYQRSDPNDMHAGYHTGGADEGASYHAGGEEDSVYSSGEDPMEGGYKVGDVEREEEGSLSPFEEQLMEEAPEQEIPDDDEVILKTAAVQVASQPWAQEEKPQQAIKKGDSIEEAIEAAIDQEKSVQ